MEQNEFKDKATVVGKTALDKFKRLSRGEKAGLVASVVVIGVAGFLTFEEHQSGALAERVVSQPIVQEQIAERVDGWVEEPVDETAGEPMGEDYDDVGSDGQPAEVATDTDEGWWGSSETVPVSELSFDFVIDTPDGYDVSGQNVSLELVREDTGETIMVKTAPADDYVQRQTVDITLDEPLADGTLMTLWGKVGDNTFVWDIDWESSNLDTDTEDGRQKYRIIIDAYEDTAQPYQS